MAASDPVSLLIYLGLALKIAGFIARDEFVLRALVVTGLACDFAFYALHQPPIFQSMFTIGTLIAVNSVLLVVILLERSTLGMNERDRRIYQAFDTLTPGQFRRVIRLGDHHVADEETRLLAEGEYPDRLYYLESGTFHLEKQSQSYTVQGPAFIGEIVFLRGGTASATVHVPPGARYVSWPVADLKALMARKRPISNALVARFSADLASKVAQSVPLPKAP